MQQQVRAETTKNEFEEKKVNLPKTQDASY